MDAMTKEAKSRLKTLVYISRLHRDMEKIQTIQSHLVAVVELLNALELTGVHYKFCDEGRDMVPVYRETVKNYAMYASGELKSLYDILVQTENRINEKYRERAFKNAFPVKTISLVDEGDGIPF